jgi:two-component system response regulator RegA
MIEPQSLETKANPRAASPGRVTQLTHAPLPLANRPGALLLDDDCGARHQLARDLLTHGFDVETSDDADAAVAAALRRRPSLVVLELRTRGAAGLDLLPRLRPQLPATKFVVLTNYGSVASAVRAMRLGATNYLCKPAAAAEVLRAAEQAASNDIEVTDEWTPPAAPALTLDEAIWEYIHRTIEEAGSLSEAARRLGLWRQSLKRMITKYRPTGPRVSGAPGLPGLPNPPPR